MTQENPEQVPEGPPTLQQLNEWYGQRNEAASALSQCEFVLESNVFQPVRKIARTLIDTFKNRSYLEVHISDHIEFNAEDREFGCFLEWYKGEGYWDEWEHADEEDHRARQARDLAEGRYSVNDTPYLTIPLRWVNRPEVAIAEYRAYLDEQKAIVDARVQTRVAAEQVRKEEEERQLLARLQAKYQKEGA